MSPRQRIVINLDPASGNKVASERNDKRLWPKVLVILALLLGAIVVVAAGTVFLWWRHYQTTPAYSLALLVDSAQRNDTAAIDQVLDTDKIVGSFADQVTEKAIGRYGATLDPTLRERVKTLVTALLPQVKPSVREALVTRVRELSVEADQKPFVVVAVGLPYYVDITREGDLAKVTTSLRERPIDMTMQQVGERWKVVAVKDDTIVPQIVDEIIQDLPAIGQPLEGLKNLGSSILGRMPSSRTKRRR